MKWLNWKRFVLALVCSGFLLQTQCAVSEATVRTAIATAGSGFVTELTKGMMKNWFDYGAGL